MEIFSGFEIWLQWDAWGETDISFAPSSYDLLNEELSLRKGPIDLTVEKGPQDIIQSGQQVMRELVI